MDYCRAGWDFSLPFFTHYEEYIMSYWILIAQSYTMGLISWYPKKIGFHTFSYFMFNTVKTVKFEKCGGAWPPNPPAPVAAPGGKEWITLHNG